MAGSAERIEIAVAREIWRAGDTFVDVRLPSEYAHGHVPGAINIPIDDLPVRLRELPDGQLVTVCSMGNRSWKAAQLLAGLGRHALSMAGGTKAWEAAGHPLLRGSEPGERKPARRPWWRRSR